MSRLRTVAIAILLALSVPVPIVSQTCSQAILGSKQAQDDTCPGNNPYYVTNHVENWPFSTKVSCNYSGWMQHSFGSSSFLGWAEGQCGAAAAGTLPVCMGLFEGPFNWGFDGLYHWLQLASYDQYVAGGGCESQNAYYFWGYHQSEDCTGSFCCSLEEECSNRDGTWESSWCECSASPIIVDLGGDGFALTSGEKGVAFDLWANGGDSKVAWTSGNSDDAFLVLDRNQNGLIDDGTELFGNVTDQPAPVPPKKRNGFAALAVFDLDADGAITARDSAYSSLALWRDRNHNGVSETSELQSLSASGLVSLTVEYRENRRKDGFGNEFRYGAKFVLNTGRTVWAYDVFLRGARDLSGQ